MKTKDDIIKNLIVERDTIKYSKGNIISKMNIDNNVNNQVADSSCFTPRDAPVLTRINTVNNIDNVNINGTPSTREMRESFYHTPEQRSRSLFHTEGSGGSNANNLYVNRVGGSNTKNAGIVKFIKNIFK